MRTTPVDKPKATDSLEEQTRNNGISLDLAWVKQVQVNKSAVERRTSTLVARRTVKKQWQAAWLLKAISCIDLTSARRRRYTRKNPSVMRQGASPRPAPTCLRPWVSRISE